MNRLTLGHNSSGQPQMDSVAFGLGVIVAGNRKMDKLITRAGAPHITREKTQHFMAECRIMCSTTRPRATH